MHGQLVASHGQARQHGQRPHRYAWRRGGVHALAPSLQAKKDKINATHRSSIDETHDRFSARAIKSFAMRNSRTGAIGPLTGTRPLIFVKSHTHRPPQPIYACVRVACACREKIAHAWLTQPRQLALLRRVNAPLSSTRRSTSQQQINTVPLQPRSRAQEHAALQWWTRSVNCSCEIEGTI